jgi:hypothetical protein
MLSWGWTPKNRSLADSSKTNHKPWRSQPSPPYHDLAQTSAYIYDQNTTIILQDERLWVNSHLVGWKTRPKHSSLSRKITGHKTTHISQDGRLQQLVISQDNRPQVISTPRKMEDLKQGLNITHYLARQHTTSHLNISQDERLEQRLTITRYLTR